MASPSKETTLSPSSTLDRRSKTPKRVGFADDEKQFESVLARSIENEALAGDLKRNFDERRSREGELRGKYFFSYFFTLIYRLSKVFKHRNSPMSTHHITIPSILTSFSCAVSVDRRFPENMGRLQASATTLMTTSTLSDLGKNCFW